jgi:hypothetical protein
LTHDIHTTWEESIQIWKDRSVNERRSYIRDNTNNKNKPLPIKRLEFAFIKTEDAFSSLVLETYLLDYCGKKNLVLLCNKESNDGMREKYFRI